MLAKNNKAAMSSVKARVVAIADITAAGGIVRWYLGAVLALLTAIPGPLIAATVRITQGDDISALVAKAALGDEFLIAAGVYRPATVVPKSYQAFKCEAGAVFNGADLLTKPWRKDGNLWVYEGVPEPSERRHGDMTKGREVNQIREDLYVDDQVLLRVDDKSKVNNREVKFDTELIYAGTFFGEKDKLYIAFDPQSRKLEYSGRTPFAIRADYDQADFVRIENCTFEKYASFAQIGAIQASFTQGWTLVNVTSRLNHGGGLRVGRNTRVEGGHYSHNGQIGIVGSSGDSADEGREAMSSQVTIDGAEIAFNNWAGYWIVWEAGGIKLLKTRNVTVKNNRVHHNFGKGIWMDWYVEDFNINRNDVYKNLSSGIAIEVSFGGTVAGNDRGVISRNTVADNAYEGFPEALDLDVDNSWWWGSQILLQNSQRVDITANKVMVNNGQGIGIIDANHRGQSDLENEIARRSQFNRVYANEVTFLKRNRKTWFDGKTGVDSDDAAKAGGYDATSAEAGNEIFENIYLFSDPNWPHWRFDGDSYTAYQIPKRWERGSQFKIVE